MYLADIIRRTLMLMNEHSVDGTEISTEDNADYLLRIPDLATMAQNEVAKAQPIIAQETLIGEPERYGDYYAYYLPSDCLGVEKVEMLRSSTLHKEPTGWMLLPPDRIAVRRPEYTWIIYYRKQPEELVDDDQELEVGLDGQDAIPFFCAAHLLMDEDLGAATLLLNQFYARIVNLAKNPTQNRVRNRMGW
jgi:hypothetical protein